MKRLRIGIVGCGALGTELARTIQTRFYDNASLEALCEEIPKKAKELGDKLKYIPQVLALEELVEKVDLVIEAASTEVVPTILELGMKHGRDVMIMSVGGLLWQDKLIKQAKESGIQIYIPSGAIGGIDALRAAYLGGVEKVELVTTKSPLSYKDAPHVIEQKIDLANIKEKTVIFEGRAVEAIQGFPKNVNVSAILSYYGIGPKKTHVKMIVDPETKYNSHEIFVTGPFGQFRMKVDNLPLPSNPKTSALAPLSAIAVLKDILERRPV